MKTCNFSQLFHNKIDIKTFIKYLKIHKFGISITDLKMTRNVLLMFI